VVVLEARGRAGGRVWSQELLPGDPRTVVERGGEFVLDGYDVMRRVLAELGLGLAGPAMSADGPATWASRAAALRPELAMDTGRALLSTWNGDPWAGESYSALTVGVAGGDEELLAAPAAGSTSPASTPPAPGRA
jgi:monoamine oxidase